MSHNMESDMIPPEFRRSLPEQQAVRGLEDQMRRGNGLILDCVGETVLQIVVKQNILCGGLMPLSFAGLSVKSWHLG